MRYLLDTVALVRHFTGSGRIGCGASRIPDSIEDNSDDFVISVVSLMEVMYLAEKNRIDISPILLRQIAKDIGMTTEELVEA